MELGKKTVTVLTALADPLDGFEAGRVLVIAPLRVTRHTWPKEIRRWDHTRHSFFDVITGSPAQRNTRLRSKVDIHILNRELIPWLWWQGSGRTGLVTRWRLMKPAVLKRLRHSALRP